MATNKELEKLVGELAESVNVLSEKVESFAVAAVTPEPVASATLPEFVPTPFAVPAEGSSPMPTEFNMVIDETLNKKFGRGIVYRTDGQFELTIKVPKEYSNAGQNHWDMYKEDSRMKVILNPLGVIGVREYITQIADNLGQEIRSKINEDRIKVA
ncbi:MAG: hypothetical protein WAV09_01625 [Minisyncoccia bacterium]